MQFVNSIAKIPLRILFLVAVTCKIVSSFLAWYLEMPWSLGFTVPLAFMAAYIVLGFQRDPNEVSDERFGDSCYYLGFVFTISSIAFSLFDIPKLDQAHKLTEVAVRFGAAMVSTFIGFVVRVYLVGFKHDVSSAMQSLEEQIIQSANALKTRMDLAQEAFRAYEEKVRHAANDTEARVRLAVENVGRHVSEEMATALRALAGEVQALHAATANELRASGKGIAAELANSSKALSEQLRQAQDLLSGFGAQLEARVREVTFPDDYFSKELAPPVASMVDSVSALAKDLLTLKESVQSSTRGLAKAMEKLDVSMEAPRSVRELVDKQELLARQVLGAISATGRMMETAATTLQGHNEQLATLTRDFSAAQSTQTEVVSAARDLVQHLTKGQQASAQELASLESLLRRLEELVVEHRKVLASVTSIPRTPAPPSAPLVPDGPGLRHTSTPFPPPGAAQPPTVARSTDTVATRPEAAHSNSSFLGRLFGRDRK